jgi:DNA-directed RNA polymerase specialized sigma24 family protein
VNLNALQAECQSVVTDLVQRHGWQLLETQTFAKQLLVRAQESGAVDAEALTPLAVNLYCLAWYAACRSQGPLRARAYQELAHYLYDRALHKYGDADMAHDMAQDALILIYEQIDDCHNPGAFMAFALLKLWNAATTYFRMRHRHVEQTELLPADETEEASPEWVDRMLPLPETTSVDRELAATLIVRVNALVQASPRAHKQYLAVLYKFLHGYSDQEIAGALETDVAGVHVLRSRGLSRLREDPVLRQLAEEYLVV